MKAAPAKKQSSAPPRQLEFAQFNPAAAKDTAEVKYPKAIAAQLQKEAFDRLCQPEADPELLRLLLGAYFKQRQLDLAEQRFRLLREKHRVMLRAIQAKLGLPSAAKAELSQAELTAIMDRLDEALGIPHPPEPATAGALAPAVTEASLL